MDHRPLFVLGMHRCGTSVLTRVLNCLGAEVGEDLLPPLAGEYARGCWEHRELVAADVHEALVREDLTDQSEFDGLRSRYEAILAAGEPFVTMACDNLRHQVAISDELRRRACAAEERLRYFEDRVQGVKDHWTLPTLRRAARILGVRGFEKGPE